MRNRVKIALIDSGVNKIITKIGGIINQGYTLVERKDGNIRIGHDFNDTFGHGTNCADIILKNCTEVEIVPIKIINDEGFSNSALLLEALKFCLSIPVKIISVSLSIVLEDRKNEEKLYDICQRLDEQNKIICVSENNNCINSIPARFDNVIGVRGTDNKFVLSVKNTEAIQIMADGCPEFTLNEKGTYNLFRGNSKANAAVAGKVANIIYQNSVFARDEVLELLQKKYHRKKYKKSQNTLNRLPISKDEYLIAKDICEIINKMKNKKFSVIELSKVPIMCPITEYTYFNIYELLETIREHYGIKKIIYRNLDVENICTLYNLTQYIYEVTHYE